MDNQERVKNLQQRKIECQKERNKLQKRLEDWNLSGEEYDEITDHLGYYDGEIYQIMSLIRYFMEK